jgi:hypothetical protein
MTALSWPMKHLSPKRSPMTSRPPSVTPIHPLEGIVEAKVPSLPHALVHDLETSL